MSDKIWGKKIFGQKKKFMVGKTGPKKFGSEKKFGPKNLLVQKTLSDFITFT